jgi:hypothetical protein
MASSADIIARMTRAEDRYALDYASFARARLYEQRRYYCENN